MKYLFAILISFFILGCAKNENLEPKEINSRSFDEKNGIYTYKMQNVSQVIFKPLATK